MTAEAHAQVVAKIEPNGAPIDAGRGQASGGRAPFERECEQISSSRRCDRELLPRPRVHLDQEDLAGVLVAQDLDFGDAVIVESQERTLREALDGPVAPWPPLESRRRTRRAKGAACESRPSSFPEQRRPRLPRTAAIAVREAIRRRPTSSARTRSRSGSCPGRSLDAHCPGAGCPCRSRRARLDVRRPLAARRHSSPVTRSEPVLRAHESAVRARPCATPRECPRAPIARRSRCRRNCRRRRTIRRGDTRCVRLRAP